MPLHDLDYEGLIKTLTDNFNVLADEVQLLSDRKIILESKLRYAHEQYQHLADKYAPGDPEISSTLAKLHLPPDLQIAAVDRAGFVPLPDRKQSASKQQTAVAIRDGRRAGQQLSTLIGRPAGSTVSGKSISGTSSNLRYSARRTSLSTVLEQDFTVPGKKGSLLCPFAPPRSKLIAGTEHSQGSTTHDSNHPLTPSDMKDSTPHHSSDPICAAMYAETMSSPPPSATGSAAKCPIRYLDQHSPEEVARYFQTHKHEIPRSHEVCVKRYQRNEDDIRKLDAKYGNLVSMIQGLGQKHQPMLPTTEDEEDLEAERTSNERVENWAHAVSADGVGTDQEEEPCPPDDDNERESRFGRPLKEVRVGESPSRPWGISVPYVETLEGERPVSPPPAPVSAGHTPPLAGTCPFGHGRLGEADEPSLSETRERPVNKCPFGHDQQAKEEMAPLQNNPAPTGKCPFTNVQQAREASPPLEPQPSTTFHNHPTFIQPQELPHANGVPQMIFTGPIFIGYPMEQAMAFMQQYKGMS